MIGLLILTNSYDVTTDLLLDRLEEGSAFRLNFDQIADYRIRVDKLGFTITDPIGRSCSSQTLKKAYWWKPYNGDPGSQEVWETYVDAEMKYVLEEMVNLLWSEQKLVLVEPFAERRTGKLLQLRFAKDLFTVPAYEFVLNQKSCFVSAIVKSLSGEMIDEKVLYTTQIDPDTLDPGWPWFVEQCVLGKQDVTIVFVRGQTFAFSLNRDFLDKSVDWRQFISPDQRWVVHEIPASLQRAILQYMNVIRLDFGRLDFLLDEHGRYWFCEVNPNGQFAWLDLNDQHGLLNAVIQEICPTTQVIPIPNHHPLRGGRP